MEEHITQLVEEYKSNHLKRKQNELFRFQNMASLEQVIRNIFIDERGNQYDHQRQGKATRERAIATLLSICDDIQGCRSFDELFDLIRIQVQKKVENVGEMFTYDAALRIGVFLGFLPKTVYLIRGAREGATALGLINRPRCLQVENFPYELRSLQPHEIHHFLCVYSRSLLYLKQNETKKVSLDEARNLMREFGKGLGKGVPPHNTAQNHDAYLYTQG